MPEVKLQHTAADPVRLSFPKLFKAGQYQNAGKFRYDATFLVKPGGANDKRIQAAILEAANEEFTKRAPAVLAAIKGNSNKYCYTPGDLKDYDGYQGMLALASHRNQEQGKPGVFDCTRAGPDGKALPLTEDSGKPYAGCYVHAVVNVWAQSGQNEGIRCSLSSVYFAAEGDAFSGSAPAGADAFDVVDAPEGAVESLV